MRCVCQLLRTVTYCSTVRSTFELFCVSRPRSKVNTLHLEPTTGFLLASSCSDGSVAIWDLRQLSAAAAAHHAAAGGGGGGGGRGKKAGGGGGSSKTKPLCVVRHFKSCQAAYWATDGSRVGGRETRGITMQGAALLPFLSENIHMNHAISYPSGLLFVAHALPCRPYVRTPLQEWSLKPRAPCRASARCNACSFVVRPGILTHTP